MNINLPKQLYSVRYNKDRFFGFNDRSKRDAAIVFTFPNKYDALRIKQQIIRTNCLPKVEVLKNDYFKIHKSPLAFAPNLSGELFVIQHKPEPFIIKTGLNGTDTCIIYELEDNDDAIIFTMYHHIKLQKSTKKHVLANLEHIYKKDL